MHLHGTHYDWYVGECQKMEVSKGYLAGEH